MDMAKRASDWKRVGRYFLVLLMGFLPMSCAIVGTPETTSPRERDYESEAPRDPVTNKKSVEESPSLNENSTLEDYLAYAALHNPGLESAFNQWKASLERIPQVKALPDPRFNYGYFIREVETRVGPQRQRFGLSQSYPWFGTLKLRGEVAGEEAKAAYERYEAAKLKLFFQVRDAFYELYYLSRAIAITRDNIQLFGELESVAQTKVAGGGDLTAVTKAQVELGRLDDRLRSLEDLHGPIIAKLNAALNRPVDADLPWPKEVTTESTDFSDEQVLAWMRDLNPELRELEFQTEREERAIRLAQKNFYPDLTVGVDYVDTRDALMPNTPDSGKDPLAVTFSINIPLWWQKYRAAVSEARYRRESVIEKRDDRENLLEANLKMALYRFRDAERKINLYGDTLTPLATQSLNVARQAWEAGRADFLDVVDAERLLLEYWLEYERSLANREQRLAELEMIVGREMPRSMPEPESGPSEN